MNGSPQIAAGEHGDFRYYRRFLNLPWIWNLQHGPRRRIVSRFMMRFQPRETDRVLDLGVTNILEPMENIFEFYYPYKHRIVAVGIEDCQFLEERYTGLQFVQVRPRQPLPFPDRSFDLGYCGATIEHVGSREDQAAFLRELLRVCRKIYLTTPNRWYPLELHTRLPFIHWLPPRLFQAILRRIGLTFYASEENLNLLSARQLRQLVPPGSFKIQLKKNYFLGFPSNLILVVERTEPHE